MEERYSRSAALLGEDAVETLKCKSVIVFGVGGVGGYVAEALARMGVGTIALVDNDVVSESNINRQIIATYDTIGMLKTEVMRKRILSINPDAIVVVHNCFYLPDTAHEFDFSKYDYVVDAVDTVTAKLGIITAAKEKDVPVISSMGAGNKLDPSAFEVADIAKTSVCPLARVIRRELKKRGVSNVKVVYSKEEPVTSNRVSGSVAYVPASAGLLIASEVIGDLIQ
ncbi:MAG: tRNA threonylcarbamoyladenosine dehydratase [Lachnospiraceae bacterium]|nr:tRNA threonylcarbamoyladenosine dehydratase [Lachnospiraceae bacterium]